MKEFIVVLGMHRSGTSAITGALQLLGGNPGPQLIRGDINNAKGYFENSRVVGLNDRILAHFNHSWDTQFPLPDSWYNNKSLANLRSEALKILSEDYTSDAINVLKDPRMGILLPFWKKIFETAQIEPRYLVVIRSPGEIGKSLNARDDFSEEKSYVLWMKHMFEIERHTRQFKRAFILFDDFVKTPLDTLKYLVNALSITSIKDLHPRSSDVLEFIDSRLKHHNRINIAYESYPDFFDNFYRTLVKLASTSSKSESIETEIDKCYDEFVSTYRLFYNRDMIDSLFGHYAKLQDLSKTLDEKIKLVDRLNDEINEKQNTIVQLRDTNANNVNHLTAKVQELQTRNSELTKITSSINDNIASIEKEKAQLLRDFHDASAQNTELNELLLVKDGAIDELNAKLREASKEMGSLSAQVDELCDKVDQLQSKLESSVREKENILRDFEQRLTTANRDISDLLKAIRAIRSSFSFRLGWTLTAPGRYFYELLIGRNGLRRYWPFVKTGLRHPLQTMRHLNLKNLRTLVHAATWEDPDFATRNMIKLVTGQNQAKPQAIPVIQQVMTPDVSQSPQARVPLTTSTETEGIQSMQLLNDIRFFHNPHPKYFKSYEEKPALKDCKIKSIAFYLPQFHAIPENDSWWGAGFTEWTNVTQGVPNFKGHYQPRLPGDLGYYSLEDESVIRKQIKIARNYGIYGFCFHYYWFSGKRLLEKPLDIFINSDIDFPFCLCWANENWTRRWDGQEDDVLMRQEYEDDDPRRFIMDIKTYISDHRYIKVNGRHLIIVYRADIIPDTRRMLSTWKDEFDRLGYAEPLIVCAQSFGIHDPSQYGFEAAVEFPPHKLIHTKMVNQQLEFYNHKHTGRVHLYEDIIKNAREVGEVNYPLIRTVFPSWDNEARKKGSGNCYIKSTPDLYREWLTFASNYALDHPVESEHLVFINAWNEWGEGAYLEPDRHFGYAYLEETYNALSAFSDSPLKSTPEQGNSLPKVSVIVPNYNHERYLQARLNSIYEQDYPNFEVVLLDDASTDKSVDILKQYAEEHDSNTRLLINVENSGCVFKQWLRGIEQCTGDLIWIAESDDFCDSNFLSSLVGLFADEAVNLAYSNIRYVDESGKTHSRTFQEYLSEVDPQKWTRPYVNTACREINTSLGIKNTIPNVSAVIFRRPEHLELFDREEWLSTRICGDWMFYLNIILGGKIGFTTKTTSYFRIHPESSSGKTFSTDAYYIEHGMVAREIAKKYNVDRKVLIANHKIIQSFYKHWASRDVSRFSELYDLESILADQQDRYPTILISILSFTHGGAEIMAIRLANQFRQMGLPVTVHSLEYFPEEPKVRKMLRADIPVVRTNDPSEFHQMLTEFGIEVLNTHSQLCQDLYSKTVDRFQRLRKEVYHVGTLHGGYETMGKEYLRKQLKRNNDRTDHWTYVADKNLEIFRQYGVFLNGKATKIYNGISSPNIVPVSRQELNIPENSFVLCLVSRAIPEKGWNEAIEITKRSRDLSGRDIHLLLIGDGPVYETLTGQILPDFIHLLGYRDNPMSYFATSDLGILPSTYSAESFPLSIVECLTVGKPVIASDVGEISNMLLTEYGRAGELFSLEENTIPIEKVSQMLCRLIKDKNLYSEIYDLALLCKDKFNIIDTAKAYLSVYTALAQDQIKH